MDNRDALEAIARHIDEGGEVRIRHIPGGKTYSPCIAIDLVTGAGFRRYHFPY